MPLLTSTGPVAPCSCCKAAKSVPSASYLILLFIYAEAGSRWRGFRQGRRSLGQASWSTDLATRARICRVTSNYPAPTSRRPSSRAARKNMFGKTNATSPGPAPPRSNSTNRSGTKALKYVIEAQQRVGHIQPASVARNYKRKALDAARQQKPHIAIRLDRLHNVVNCEFVAAIA
jgi:hypothetical protein